MKYLAKTTKEGGMHFESDFTRRAFVQFCKSNPNTIIELIPRSNVSREARGYFEGAIVPAYCEWAEGLDPLNPSDCAKVREMMKLEFNGVFVNGLDKQPVKIPVSTKRMTKAQFTAFLDKITDYFVKEMIPIPNPDLYKKWRDELSIDEPTLTFWEYLRKYGIACDGTQFPQKRVAKKNKDI